MSGAPAATALHRDRQMVEGAPAAVLEGGPGRLCQGGRVAHSQGARPALPSHLCRAVLPSHRALTYSARSVGPGGMAGGVQAVPRLIACEQQGEPCQKGRAVVEPGTRDARGPRRAGHSRRKHEQRYQHAARAHPSAPTLGLTCRFWLAALRVCQQQRHHGGAALGQGIAQRGPLLAADWHGPPFGVLDQLRGGPIKEGWEGRAGRWG